MICFLFDEGSKSGENYGLTNRRYNPEMFSAMSGKDDPESSCSSSEKYKQFLNSNEAPYERQAGFQRN